MKDLECGLANTVARYCPVCDGYETGGKKVAVLGPGTHGQSEAEFLAEFDNEVTWLSMGSRRGQSDDLSELATDIAPIQRRTVN